MRKPLNPSDRRAVELIRNAQVVTIMAESNGHAVEIICGGRVPHDVAISVQDHLGNGGTIQERQPQRKKDIRDLFND